MDKQSVKGIMECYGYNNSKLKVSNKELDIDDVFIKDDKEVYIILEDELWMDKIESYQRMILWFQNCVDNEIIKYNINIIILYRNLDIEQDFKMIDYIKKYERDLHFCRKLFINLDDENSLNILPFYKIKSVSIERKDAGLRERIDRIINNNVVVEELIKETPDFNIINEFCGQGD
ncbi:MAG: hypothetical protein E6423_05535 [Clostridium sp.]|uniref:hypothetical protein n=1 Tax=Clostridium paraputrificum TaxID=29363 RepID=UPI00189E683D|nr:hypothetical protein [Clostridium paraputrificum]MDU6808230.1 hypothetical protein [Clostridium sp.]